MIKQIIVNCDEVAVTVNGIGQENIVAILPFKYGSLTDFLHFSQSIADNDFTLVYEYFI